MVFYHGGLESLLKKICWISIIHCSAFDGDDGTGAASVASASSAGKGTRTQPIMESLGEDGNINISNVTNVVVGKVGNLFGKGIGGIGSKLGGGGWF